LSFPQLLQLFVFVFLFLHYLFLSLSFPFESLIYSCLPSLLVFPFAFFSLYYLHLYYFPLFIGLYILLSAFNNIWLLKTEMLHIQEEHEIARDISSCFTTAAVYFKAQFSTCNICSIVSKTE
jgi:hypothetical protein